MDNDFETKPVIEKVIRVRVGEYMSSYTGTKDFILDKLKKQRDYLQKNIDEYNKAIENVLDYKE